MNNNGMGPQSFAATFCRVKQKNDPEINCLSIMSLVRASVNVLTNCNPQINHFLDKIKEGHLSLAFQVYFIGMTCNLEHF